jgi:hypothetical protein
MPRTSEFCGIFRVFSGRASPWEPNIALPLGQFLAERTDYWQMRLGDDKHLIICQQILDGFQRPSKKRWCDVVGGWKHDHALRPNLSAQCFPGWIQPLPFLDTRSPHSLVESTPLSLGVAVKAFVLAALGTFDFSFLVEGVREEPPCSSSF